MAKKAPAEDRLRLGAEVLARRCDPASFGFADTHELEPLTTVAGQPRALAALEFGLETRAPGFHLFVMGPVGTGRQSTVLALLADRAPGEPVPPDLVYVHDYDDPDRPRLLELPPGLGRGLAREVDESLRTGSPVAGLAGRWGDHPGVVAHLLAADRDLSRERTPEAVLRARVNPFLDHRPDGGAPVVVESNPTYANLFGSLEYRPRDGHLATDHTLLRAGAVHRARGGYLVLQARDVLANPHAWETLKRVLATGECRVENPDEPTHAPLARLRPQPVPVALKVILIGSPMLHHTLFVGDDDFRSLFKVKADFDDEMVRTADSELLYARFLAGRSQAEGLLPFDRDATALVVDYGARLVEHQDRLSTEFMEIADLAREASHWATRAHRPHVAAEDVVTALEQRKFRVNLMEDRLQDLIDSSVIRIDVGGEAVGQVNGLSVLEGGDYDFGRPSRITARVSLGKDGVMDIERESEISGRIHSKGVLILAGFLSGRFAERAPLSVSISLCFEQTYDEVDGDSAASTEVYAILSALAHVPLKQAIAVTGSVDQFGNVQAIGGVNEKVEGFFEVCRSRGLTRRQGVLIPRANLAHLMLKPEVQEAVARGRFHLWAISHVDEGLEILTGIPAGKRRSDGRFPRNSVNGMVQLRLERMADDLREFNRE